MLPGKNATRYSGQNDVTGLSRGVERMCAKYISSFACAAYRRSSNYIRIPTTVIGKSRSRPITVTHSDSEQV